ncbi:hypothetical protein GBF38_000159 [Nibea albiflora]|nr:hypothetical protein GBF38_000159 [Nibea albiflora]
MWQNEGSQSEDTTQSSRETDGEEGKSDELTQRLPGVKPDTPSAVNINDHDPLDAYKRAAPRLLHELACLLSRHKWTERGCIPHGIVNILNYSWHDLTAGAVVVAVPRGESQRGSQKLDEARASQVSANDKREAAERDSCDARNDCPPVRKPQVSSNPRVKKRKQNDNKVSQSHTGLPCGGFYTNVFSDSERPVILATITAFGHGAVTHPSEEVLQMASEVEVVEEPSAQWRRGGQVGRELKRLQQRVRNTLDDWLDYYRVAIGTLPVNAACLGLSV